LARGLEVRDLAVEVGGRVVLGGVDLEAEGGSLVAIEGPTGSGKTTLLKAVTGLLQTLYTGRRVGGYVRVLGLEPAEALRRGLAAYVPQDPYSFFLGGTPAEEASLVGVDFGELRRCSGVDPALGFTQLSDGQLYRVLLCLALLSGARLVALDEPTSHVDPWSLGEVMTSIRDYARRFGAVVVVADHRPEVVEPYVDVVLRLGPVEAPCRLPGTVPSGRGEAVASLRGVSVGYGSRVVVGGATLEVRRGGGIAILGRNGAGKTTLLKALTGLLRTSGGRYVGRGTRVFLVPQSPIYWFQGGTVEEELRTISRGGYRDVVELLGIEGLLGRSTYSLSVGESRLVSVALALASGADLIVVDEPTLGLDCGGRRRVAEALARVVEGGASVVVATHDPAFAGVFEEVYVVEGGRVGPS
jgi:energy-coupling factor transport system ATP-binding protein